jgi:hypothetical protein
MGKKDRKEGRMGKMGEKMNRKKWEGRMGREI